MNSLREKQILVGLYLSKFDSAGLEMLGFESFTEAFNVIGYALGAKPASIKNYRDEFDPLFPNPRRGWHKRVMRDHCLKVLDQYGNLNQESFAALIRSFAGYEAREADSGDSQFARRLITGLAAERYFLSVHSGLVEFKDRSAEDTTAHGCGYDFRMRARNPDDFLAVEVKGLHGRTGNVALTPKEYATAATMKDRFFLFVVKNFREAPYHEIFPNPLASQLRFLKKETRIVQIAWLADV